jgi:hypothetical protein
MRILRDAGITYRQVDSWCRNYYLRPWHDGGQGNRREWPTEELEVALLMKRLIDVGILAGQAAGIARQVLKARRAAGVNDAPVGVDLGDGIRLVVEPAERNEQHARKVSAA